MEELGDFLVHWRDLARSGRPVEETIIALANMPVRVPGHDEPVRLGDLRDDVYLRLTAECLSKADPEVFTFILDERAVEGYDVDALLRQVSCPVLLLKGDPALMGLEDKVAERAVALLPHGTLVGIQEAGHNIHRTQPKAAVQAVAHFLESL
jgi:pimeloyl-ACP methyl ester carboxylesterase